MDSCSFIPHGGDNLSFEYINLSTSVNSGLYNVPRFNGTPDYSDYDLLEEFNAHYHPKYFYIPIVFYCVGIIENVVTFLAMRCMKHGGDTLYQIMANLCICDTLVLVTAVVYYSLSISNGPNGPLPNSTVCALILIKCVLTSAVFAEAFTTLSLVAFTTTKLSKPLHTMNLLSGAKKWLLFLAIWLISGMLGFSVLFKVMADSPILSYSCVCITYAFGDQYDHTESLLSSVLLGASIVVVSVCYGINLQIARNAKKKTFTSKYVLSRYRNKSRQDTLREKMEGDFRETDGDCTYDGGTHKMKHGSFDSNYKLAVTAVMLYAVLIIFWGPYVIVNFVCLNLIDPDCPWFSYIVTTIFVLNSLLDPVIYGVRLRSVRKGYVALFYKVKNILNRTTSMRRRVPTDL